MCVAKTGIDIHFLKRKDKNLGLIESQQAVNPPRFDLNQ